MCRIGGVIITELSRPVLERAVADAAAAGWDLAYRDSDAAEAEALAANRQVCLRAATRLAAAVCVPFVRCARSAI